MAERIAAPKPGPSVGGVLLGWTLVGAAASAALPVAVATALAIRWRGWRPWPMVAAATAALAAEVLLLQERLLAYHLTGWRTYLPSLRDHAFSLFAANLWYTLPVGAPLGVIVGALFMAASEHGAAGAPWHPGTIRRAARRDRRDARRVRRLLGSRTGIRIG